MGGADRPGMPTSLTFGTIQGQRWNEAPKRPKTGGHFAPKYRRKVIKNAYIEDTEENIENAASHNAKQSKLDENKKLKNNNNSNKNYFFNNKININNINNFNSIKIENTNQNKRYKNKTNIYNPRRKTYSKEKETIHFNKEIKKEIIKKKNRNTISYNKALESKKLTKNSKSKKKLFYNSIKKQTKKKNNNKINYNMYTNINNNLNNEDFIIDNDNDDLDESIQLICLKDKNSDNQKKELKKKLIKAKRQIIKIKKELHNNKEKNSINNSNTDKDDINIIDIKNTINARIDNSPNNQIELNDKNIINNISNIENNKISKIINKENTTKIINSRNNFTESNLKGINHVSISSNPNSNTNESKRMTTKLNQISAEIQNNIKVNNNYHNESDLDRIFIKNNKNDYFEKDDTLHSSCNNLNIINKNNKNENTINKLSIEKKKLNSDFTPQKNKIYNVYDNKKIKIKRCDTMNNKQIKNNIPAYRRSNFKVNNFYPSILNTATYDSKKSKQTKKVTNIKSLESSFNKSFNTSDLKVKKLNKNKYINENKGCSLNKNNIQNNRDTFIFNKSTIQQSYINNSSILKNSINDSNIKFNNSKNQRLFYLISNNFINNNNLNNSNDKIEKENKNKHEQQKLYQNLKKIEINLSPNNINESLINKDLLESRINNTITLNYNKLHSINTSIILYDGFLFKIVEDKNKGFKIIERYFQIMKNCFKYYPNLEKSLKNSDKPLVQFDIRHIKFLSIIKNDIFKQFKIKEKEIEFVISIFLNQNNDFFVFAFNDKEIGNSVFNIINLLKNYYEDKSN